jgi:hypothetical protein
LLIPKAQKLKKLQNIRSIDLQKPAAKGIPDEDSNLRLILGSFQLFHRPKIIQNPLRLSRSAWARNKENSSVTQLHEVFRLNVMINDDFVGFKNSLNDSTRVVVSLESPKLEIEGYNCDGILNLLRFQFVSTQFFEIVKFPTTIKLKVMKFH